MIQSPQKILYFTRMRKKETFPLVTEVYVGVDIACVCLKAREKERERITSIFTLFRWFSFLDKARVQPRGRFCVMTVEQRDINAYKYTDLYRDTI